MLLTMRHAGVYSATCGILQVCSQYLAAHTPVKIKQLLTDVHALFLSEPEPD